MLIPRHSDLTLERHDLVIQGKTPVQGHDADSSRAARFADGSYSLTATAADAIAIPSRHRQCR